MPITLPPSPWPSTAAAASAAAWHAAIQVTDSLARQGARTMLWDMRRNGARTGLQLAAVFGSLCALALGIAALCAANGARSVAAGAVIELVAVGMALLLYARHLADRETITLTGRSLDVECVDGRAVARSSFRAEWLVVEPCAGQGSLIELSGQGQRVRVGRFVRPEQRAELARELRRALRLACLLSPPEHPLPQAR